MAGFTLIEIMVVLVIAVLMLTLVPPMFSKTANATELKSAAREIAAALRYARGQAVLRHNESVLTLDTAQHRYRVTGQKGFRNLSKKIQLSMTTSRSERLGKSTSSIRFYPDGSATGGQIKLANPKQKFTIDVNWLTGRIAIY